MEDIVKKVLCLMERIDNTYNNLLILEVMSVDDAYRKHYKNFVSRDEYDKIVELDPFTKSNSIGKITQWLMGLIKQGEVNINDIDNIKPHIELYYKFRHKLSNELNNLQNIKSLNKFYDLMKEFSDNPEQATSKSDTVRGIKNDGTKKIYEDDRWLILSLLTEAASCYYGKNTKWCTASSKFSDIGINEFNKYIKDGSLIYIEDKLNKKKYQYHKNNKTGEISLMNAEDLFVDHNTLELPNEVMKMLFNVKEGIVNGWKYSFHGFEVVRGEIINPINNDTYIYIKGVGGGEYLITDSGEMVDWKEVNIPNEIINSFTNLK